MPGSLMSSAPHTAGEIPLAAGGPAACLGIAVTAISKAVTEANENLNFKDSDMIRLPVAARLSVRWTRLKARTANCQVNVLA
jgi:hypothetical protein